MAEGDGPAVSQITTNLTPRPPPPRPPPRPPPQPNKPPAPSDDMKTVKLSLAGAVLPHHPAKLRILRETERLVDGVSKATRKLSLIINDYLINYFHEYGNNFDHLPDLRQNKSNFFIQCISLGNRGSRNYTTTSPFLDTIKSTYTSPTFPRASIPEGYQNIRTHAASKYQLALIKSCVYPFEKRQANYIYGWIRRHQPQHQHLSKYHARPFIDKIQMAINHPNPHRWNILSQAELALVQKHRRWLGLEHNRDQEISNKWKSSIKYCSIIGI